MDILNQFGVQPILLAAQIVNFLILLFILKKFLYGPIIKMLDARKQKIEDSLKNAQEIEQKLQETEIEVDKILAKANSDAQKIINESKETAAKIIEDSKQSGTEIINKAYSEAMELKKAESLKLQQEVRENLADVVALVLEKVTGQKVTPSDQKKLIDKEIKNLS